METTLKLREILKLNSSLSQIIESDIDSLFKFKILGVLNVIEPLIENYSLIRREKINKYGKPSNENENQVVITPDDLEAITKFNEDMNELLNSEVTVNIKKFKADYIFTKGIDVNFLIDLYPIIEE